MEGKDYFLVCLSNGNITAVDMNFSTVFTVPTWKGSIVRKNLKSLYFPIFRKDLLLMLLIH